MSMKNSNDTIEKQSRFSSSDKDNILWNAVVLDGLGVGNN
jgi:hypothetical protein